MAEQLDKQSLTRLAWITELRRQGDRQCTGPWRVDSNQVCAIVLLHELVECHVGRMLSPRDTAEAHAGLSQQQIDAVIAMNDGKCCRTGEETRKHTFSEIADVVEGWFK